MTFDENERRTKRRIQLRNYNRGKNNMINCR